MSLRKDDFEHALQMAVSQQSAEYKNTASLHIRWENDDTEAATDAAHFQTIVSAFGFSFGGSV